VEDRKWERIGALGGVVFVVLVLVAAFLPGSPPSTSDPTSKIVKWVADNGKEIRWAGYLGALAVIPFFWWVGSLWRLLRRAEGDVPRLAVVAALGATFGAATGAISGVILAVLPIAANRPIDAPQLRTVYLLGSAVGFMSLFGISALIGAASVVFVRSRVMPAVLGWFGIFVALLVLVGAYGTVSTRDAVMAFGFASYLLSTLWVLVTSILMYRSARDGARAG
jgi:hypothetical protein